MSVDLSITHNLAKALLVSFLFICSAAYVQAGDVIYFSLQATNTLPATPSSLLLQSPSFIDVPQGAVLTVHLMKADQVVSTSKLVFNSAVSQPSLIPSVPLASFSPTGTTVLPGQPLSGATLTGGTADLNAIAANPGQYKIFWWLSNGVMGTPGRAVMTGAPVGFVDLKLAEISAAVRQSDQKPGSVLIFPRYSSDFYESARNNATLSVTNTSPSDTAYVRMFLVSSADCSSVEISFCLSAQQTQSFKMSDYDPGTKGYCIVVASNQNGQPVQFNWLIGQAQMRIPVGGNSYYDATAPALVLAKRSGGAVTIANNSAEMAFDDAMYDRLPSQLAADNVPSQVSSQNSTVLSVMRPISNLGGASVNPSATITAYNNAGTASAVSRSLSCYYEGALSSLRFSPTALNTLIPTDSTGWLKLSTADSLPLIGMQFNSGKYTSGAQLRALAYTADYRISVPIKAVTCQ